MEWTHWSHLNSNVELPKKVLFEGNAHPWDDLTIAGEANIANSPY